MVNCYLMDHIHKVQSFQAIQHISYYASIYIAGYGAFWCTTWYCRYQIPSIFRHTLSHHLRTKTYHVVFFNLHGYENLLCTDDIIVVSRLWCQGNRMGEKRCLFIYLIFFLFGGVVFQLDLITGIQLLQKYWNCVCSTGWDINFLGICNNLMHSD